MPPKSGNEADRDGIVAGTVANDVIDSAYVDSDGDVVDGGDAILDGAAPDDDLIRAGAGDDTVKAGKGNDTVWGGDGSDTIEGGDGDDLIIASGTESTPDRGFPAHGGNPAIPADADPNDDRDTVYGGDGNDTILTGDDQDTVFGDAGNDLIDAGDDDDTVQGGTGDDKIIGGEGNDTLDGNDGDDTIYGDRFPSTTPDPMHLTDDGSDGLGSDPDPTNNIDTIRGGEGNDTIYGQDDADNLSGGAGNDTIDGGIDNDEIDGGTGDDTLIGGQGDDRVFGGDGDDSLDGGSGDDRLFGGDGADVIDGGDGADIIGTGIGDTVRGGEGGNDNDVLIVDGLATVDYDETDPTGESGTITYYNDDLSVAGTSTFSEMEHVISVGTPSNTPTAAGVGPGVPGSAAFRGVVEGTAGDDTIDHGYSDDPEGDRVDNGDARPPLEGDEDLILAGGGNDTVHGRAADDVIFGGEGDDTLFGDEGNDSLSGDEGDDVLDGGAGNDIVSGGSGNDTISGSNDIAGDSNDILAGGEDNDTFVKISQGDQIIGGEDADGRDIDTINLRGVAEAANPGGTLTVEYDPDNGENGTIRFFDDSGAETGTATFQGIERIVPCFTPGTLIATPEGERLVEDLKPGDRVITRDNGIQRICWTGDKTLSAQDLAIAPKFKPVMIRRGALGHGLPERDMVVSPNHRMLVANDRTSYYFDDSEVLVPAKFLAGLEGVRSYTPKTVTYMHFMFEQHEVVLADGAWSESFQPGDMSLGSMGADQREEIFGLFPDLKTAQGIENYTAARRSLKRFEAELLM